MPCLQQRKTEHVDVLHPLPGVEVGLEGRGVVVRVDARVVEEHVDAADSALTRSNISRTWSSSVTSATSASSPSAPSARSTPARAPSAAKTRADSAPIPLAAPVITQTFPRDVPSSCLRRVVHVLDLGVVVERVGPELATDPGLLEPPNGVVTRTELFELIEITPVSIARDPQRLGPVAGPDRAREAVDGVVGSSTASASPSNGITQATGPKISSVAARSEFETGASTVGGYQKPARRAPVRGSPRGRRRARSRRPSAGGPRRSAAPSGSRRRAGRRPASPLPTARAPP